MLGCSGRAAGWRGAAAASSGGGASSSSSRFAPVAATAGAGAPAARRLAVSAPVRPGGPGRRAGAVVVQARKLSHLRKKMWKEAGPPPDLATRLFSERIIYLGMPIDSSVAELITAQLFVLSQEAPQPIYLYINSTGIAKSNTKYGNEHEAVAVYSVLRAVQKFCPVYTLAMGNAFGEAALLLAAGSPGKRAALRSSTIMLRQPLQRLVGMQASDIDIYRRVTREKTATMAKYLAASTGKTEEDILRDFARPRYFTPYEAVEYGLIDQVLEPSDGRGDVKKDWEGIGINATRVWGDEEQPMPTNVMWEGTSDYWRNDDFLAAESGGGRDWAQEALDADENDPRRAEAGSEEAAAGAGGKKE